MTAQKIKIHAVANAPKSDCVGEYLDAVKIKIGAPAVNGKANAELLKFVAKKLNLPRSAVKLLSGETSREKILQIEADFDCRAALLGKSS